jgi:hypothetical protein
LGRAPSRADYSHLWAAHADSDGHHGVAQEQNGGLVAWAMSPMAAGLAKIPMAMTTPCGMTMPTLSHLAGSKGCHSLALHASDDADGCAFKAGNVEAVLEHRIAADLG